MFNGNESGFTVIELVLVIIIVAVVGIVISLNLGGLDSITLNNAEKKLVGDLRYAQQLAITTGIRHGLRVDTASDMEYSLYMDDGAETPIKDPVNLGQDFIVNFNTYQQGQLAGVIFNPDSPFCSAAEIEFNGIGAPTDDTGNPIACSPNITLQLSTETTTIAIQQNTGNLTY